MRALPSAGRSIRHGEEVRGQGRDVLASGTQRGDADVDRVKVVVEARVNSPWATAASRSSEVAAMSRTPSGPLSSRS